MSHPVQTHEPTLGAPSPPTEGARELAKAEGISLTAADVLFRAGHKPGEVLQRFLEPKLAHLTPPDRMADIEVFVDRMAHAISKKERIAIFGDYDCDGITACAIMTSIVRGLGGTAIPMLATRREGAYGLSAPAVARIRAASPQLVVTCDCGSSDHDRIDALRATAIDTLVIDHHLVPAEPLPARAFLNPHRPDCEFPFKWLASCGLSLTVGAMLRRRLQKQLDLRPLLDLVAVGTIADVAPLVGDNRALVRAGLGVLRQGSRPGLRALGDLARFDFSRGVNAEDVAFRLAPRINAPGRLGDPDPAMELLLAPDMISASALAATVEQMQSQRRVVQAEIMLQAEDQIKDGEFSSDAGIVVADERWHPGIVGIVAGRIADATQLPTVVIAIEGATGRGSVRGPRGFPLHDALSECRAELIAFGGHQAAAGLHLAAERIASFRAAWVNACARLAKTVVLPQSGAATVQLQAEDHPTRVAQDLVRLEPCGEGNPLPLLWLEEVVVVRARSFGDVLKLDVRFGNHQLSAVSFQDGHVADAIVGAKLNLVGAVRINTFTGGVEVQITKSSPRLASFATKR